MQNSIARALFTLILSISVAHSLQGQAKYAAERQSDIEVGAGFLAMSPDAVPQKVYGGRVWGTLNFNRHLGLDAEYNMGSIVTPNDISENSFMVGPRYTYHYHRTAIYGKFVGGMATFKNSPSDQPNFWYDLVNSPFAAWGFGGGFEYTMKRKIKLRPVDVEVQKWGNFAPHTLSPVLVTFGVQYIVR